MGRGMLVFHAVLWFVLGGFFFEPVVLWVMEVVK